MGCPGFSHQCGCTSCASYKMTDGELSEMVAHISYKLFEYVQ